MKCGDLVVLKTDFKSVNSNVGIVLNAISMTSSDKTFCCNVLLANGEIRTCYSFRLEVLNVI